MSDFSAYEKMPNSLKKLGLKESDFATLEKVKWVVTEKVHGANFSFIYENGKLKYAKRKAYLSWQNDFFGFQLVVNRIEDNIIRLFEALSLQIKGSKYIVYGELFGGKYPHPEVKENENIQAIQTGVYYSPSIHFYAFDIAIETEGVASKYYLDYETALSYFRNHGILHAKPLWIGKFHQALEFNTRINSTLPVQFNLPELANNLMEGVVIKPYNLVKEDTLSSRPIFKLKNAEFDEEEKFHQAEKWTYRPTVSSKTEDLSFLIEELRNYITYNRLESAISKIGALEVNNTQRISEIQVEFLNDVFTDFNENNNNLLMELSPAQKQWIDERIKSEFSKLIKGKISFLN
ncbi:RNA ligase family protein [Rapidithrix thailandica]|uniref:RNA ligase family protein n=1 Tax=Rapidithrix thailandica TaxID=413964 RepID=A0AAW9SGA6_9BACT